MRKDIYQFKGAWITNATYAYLAIKDGNDGSATPMVRKFENNDWFKLTAVGYDAQKNEIGRLDFYLADYRDGKTEIIKTWQWFDWTALADADYITFELSSTDNGKWGMNTPAYFCIDGVSLLEK